MNNSLATIEANSLCQIPNTDADIGEFARLNSTSAARGIVACGDQDGFRWQPSFAFYYKGRKNNRPWIWVSISNTGHNRSAKFENFVRMFFDEELAVWRGEKEAVEDLHADVSNIKNEMLLLSEQPELQSPFRTKKLLDAWRKIQAP